MDRIAVNTVNNYEWNNTMCQHANNTREREKVNGLLNKEQKCEQKRDK